MSSAAVVIGTLRVILWIIDIEPQKTCKNQVMLHVITVDNEFW